MNKVGITSSQFVSDSEFKMDFTKFKEYGYDSIDYDGMINTSVFDYSISDEDFKGYFKRMKKEIDKYGLVFGQLHALWDSRIEEVDRENLLSYYIKALDAAGILGTPYVVIHPISPDGWNKTYTDKEIIDANIKFFKALIPYAIKNNTKIAVENLPFLDHKDVFSPLGTFNLINLINDDNVVMCLDTGHMHMFKVDPYDTVIKIKDKLRALHIHDNNTQSDYHGFPYTGTIDWDKFLKGLKDIKFDGVLSLETSAPNNLPEHIFNNLAKALSDIIHMFRDKLKD